ncbi:hypothetical protein [Pseudomonas sp. NFACC47-1]|uniref:hypothetical protein n=1 Tax=Pseudomonas sp. NFACC47-1 TaxID=1566199 RepID=UPI000910D6C5|nr:hypothetical protein [Pseudomonas sp. NFACC47-1]SFW98342.1 hypothetical protein SAMN03159442_00003 [Pseudomonas sp. NFACC47-1]
MPPSSTPADQTVLLEKPDLPRATRPVVGGDFGVPKHIYDQEPAGCKVLVLPYTNQTGGENVSINLNGETNIDNRDTLGIDDTVELYIPNGKLRPGMVNRLTYTVRRLSGIPETSDPPVEILYNEFRPGLFDRTPGDGAHSELELILPDEIKNGVGPGFTRATVCVSYPYCRAHDRIWLNCNGKPKYHTVPDTEAPSPPDPGSPTPTTICFDVTSADLGDDHAQFMFSFTVTDQLGNSPDLNSPWSAVQTVDVDQAGLRLPVPIPREIASDTADDPGIIDLEKLGTNPLLLIVLTSDPRFLPGDTIEATYVAKVVGQPEVTHSETGTVETDGFGQKQACVLEIPNDKVISGSTVQASYKLFRGTTLVGTSKTAHATVIGAAQNLLPPSVKEANGPILNPVQAKDALHIVVPANAALLPDDKLKVTWTGAAGTPAGGSHTSGEWPIRDGWEVPIPNSVVAFNLGKSVTVTYTVIQNGVESPPSDPFVLNVQALSQDDLLVARPRILQAANNGEGAELDVATFTGNATVRIDAWPLIAQGQYVWLRLKGKNNDGTDYERVLWSSALGSRVSASWVSDGFATNTVPFTELQGLRNGSTLTVEFKATLNQSAEEGLADTFPLRTYTVTVMTALRVVSLTASPRGAEHLFLPESGFPKTGFNHARFTINVDGGQPPYSFSASNSAYASIHAQTGEVQRTTYHEVIFTITDAAQPNPNRATFVMKQAALWFTGLYGYETWSTAAGRGRLPQIGHLTLGQGVRGIGTLFGEWGDMQVGYNWPSGATNEHGAPDPNITEYWTHENSGDGSYYTVSLKHGYPYKRPHNWFIPHIGVVALGPAPLLLDAFGFPPGLRPPKDYPDICELEKA